MRPQISGTTLPVLQIELDPGEKVIAGPDQLSWMTDNIAMNTTTATGGSASLWGAVGRALSGGGLFMTEYSAKGNIGIVAFTAKLPGSIVEVQVQSGRGYLIHKHGFLCATEGVELSTALQQSLGAGVFGGEGFVLEKLAGQCTAWVEVGGEIVNYDLKAGQALLVHPAHVGMFEDSISFEVVTMSGVRNALFGGDGFFLVKLTGPGKVWLQTLTAPGLAHAVAGYLPRPGN